MRRPRTIRRWLKWGALLLSTLVMVAWAISIGWELRYTHVDRANPTILGGTNWGRAWHLYPVLGVGLTEGCFVWEHGLGSLRKSGWFVNRHLVAPRWLPQRYGIEHVWPMWIPCLLVVLPTAILWWRDRRPPSGCCQTCGYDLTGNTSGVCPECGYPVLGRGKT